MARGISPNVLILALLLLLSHPFRLDWRNFFCPTIGCKYWQVEYAKDIPQLSTFLSSFSRV